MAKPRQTTALLAPTAPIRPSSPGLHLHSISEWLPSIFTPKTLPRTISPLYLAPTTAPQFCLVSSTGPGTSVPLPVLTYFIADPASPRSQLLQLVLHEAKLFHFPHIIPPYPLLRPSYSPLAQASREPVCENPQAFPTSAPVSKPLTMGLTSEANRIVREFDYGDADLNKGVFEFLSQMGMLTTSVPPNRPLRLAYNLQTLGWRRTARA